MGWSKLAPIVNKLYNTGPHKREPMTPGNDRRVKIFTKGLELPIFDFEVKKLR